MRVLSRGLSAVRRGQLHRAASDRTGATVQYASGWKDEYRRSLEWIDGRRRDHELRQRTELYSGMSDGYSAHPCDLRNESRHYDRCIVWLAEKIISVVRFFFNFFPCFSYSQRLP